MNKFYRIDHKEDIPFYVTEDKSVSYKDAIDKIERITTLFDNNGLKSGDKIAIMSEDDLEVSLLFIAALLNGITVTILDRETKAIKLNSILNLLEPKLLFIDKDKSKSLDSNLDCSRYLISKEEKSSFFNKLFSKISKTTQQFNYYEKIKKAKPIQPQFKAKDNDTAYILFTSGTTSEPKGVEISYFALSEHLKTLQKVYKIDKESKILNILELSHGDGIIQGPLLAFFSNISLYRPFRFKINKIQDLLEFIYSKEITHFISVPSMLSLINQFSKKNIDLLKNSSILYISSAGALLETKLWKDFQNNFGKDIINVYGLTESVAGGLFTQPGNKEHIGTIGEPIDSKAKIVNKDGKEVLDGEVGELILSGNHIMKGYYKNRETTLEVLKDGWLYTGDLAYKQNGIFTITGRVKNIISTKGFTVYPEEITTVINEHPLVQESVVFGVENPTIGEEIVAAIVVKDKRDISKTDILEYCREHLESYKIPKRVEFLESLPKGRSGKVVVSEVKEIINNGDLKEISLEKDIFKLAAEHFLVPLEQINKDSSSETISSWDSLGHLEFIALLESHFNITFNTAEMMRIEKLGDIIDIVKEKIKGVGK